EQVQEKSLFPAGAGLAASANAAYFRQVMAECGLTHASSLMQSGSEQTVGFSRKDVREIADTADAVINISGWLDDPTLTSHVPVRIYIDVDPGFTQLWHAVDGIDIGFGVHTHYFTVGLRIGRHDCPVPTCGIQWMTTLPPGGLAAWPRCDDIT